MIRAGRHDQKLTFQRVTTAGDGMGSVTETWADFCVCWGEVRVDRSDEAVETGQRTGREMLIVSTRADNKTKLLTASDRLVWNNRNYNLSPSRAFPAGRPERIEFTATAGSN